MAWVGQSIERVEDAALLTGRGRYIDDLPVSPGTLHAAVLRYAGRGYTILFVGHEGHPEVEGVMGEAPDQVKLVHFDGKIPGTSIAVTEPGLDVWRPAVALDGRGRVVVAWSDVRAPRTSVTPCAAG